MAIEWKTINPDFSDSTASMKNAITSLSQAGTVFGEMRKSILEEEQRALENAFKQQEFNEKIRQFEEEQRVRQSMNDTDNAAAMERLKYAENQAMERLKHAEDQATKRQRIARAQSIADKTAATKAHRAGYEFFENAFKKGNFDKAVKDTLAFMSTNYPTVTVDTARLFGTYAPSVAAYYHPNARATRGIEAIHKGAVAKQEYEALLHSPAGNYAIFNGKVFREDGSGGVSVVENPAEKQKAKQDLALAEQFKQEYDKNINVLVDQGISPDRAAGLVMRAGGLGAYSPEAALNEFSALTGLDLSKNTLAAPIFQEAKNTREIETEKAKAEAKRANDLSLSASERAYSKEDSIFIENLIKDEIYLSEEMNASIATIRQAMLEENVPSDEFKAFLSKLRSYEHKRKNKWNWSFRNDDVTSKDLNNPVLREYAQRYITNTTEEKSKTESETDTKAENANTSETSSTGLAVSPDAPKSLIRSLRDSLKRSRDVSAILMPDSDVIKRYEAIDKAIADLERGEQIEVDADTHRSILKMLGRFRALKPSSDSDAWVDETSDYIARFIKLQEAETKGKTQ